MTAKELFDKYARVKDRDRYLMTEQQFTAALGEVLSDSIDDELLKEFAKFCGMLKYKARKNNNTVPKWIGDLVNELLIKYNGRTKAK